MPFTFCHPAIVLPFKNFPRKWFSIIGLIIGSMSPDFEYFLKMRISSQIGHSVFGIFVFDLPLSILVAYVFFNTVSVGLVNNLPEYFKSRLIFITKINWNDYFKRNWYIVIYSIIIGSITHILWDSFTHKAGYFVLKYKCLSEKILILSYPIPIYKFLQHGSTLLAGLFILFYISNLKSENVFGKIDFIYWLRVTSIAIMIILLRILLGGFGSIGTFIVTGIAAGLYSLILTPLIFKRYNLKST